MALGAFKLGSSLTPPHLVQVEGAIQAASAEAIQRSLLLLLCSHVNAMGDGRWGCGRRERAGGFVSGEIE